MKYKILIVLLTIIHNLTYLITTQSVISIECLQFKNSQCIRCPPSSHLFDNECYNDIMGCTKYKNGYECIQCNSSFSVLSNKTCNVFVSNNEIKNIYNFTVNPGDRFGQSMFNLISLTDAQQDNYFITCDNYMKKGQYGHFISRTGQSIISVHNYDIKQTRQFKILYEGSGGGILLCIIGINLKNNQIQLRSFVVIGVNRIIDECIDYTTNSQCIRCDNGFHLENSLCFKNIPKCKRYYKNICLQCKGFSLLVQNRCISDCKSIKDTRSIQYYHNYFQKDSILPNVSRIYSVSSV